MGSVPLTFRRLRTAIGRAVVLVSLTSGACPDLAAAQQEPFFYDDPLAFQALPSGPLYGILLRACPDERIQASELDAVRVIEGKLAVAAAMRAAAQRASEVEIAYGKPGVDGQYRFANTPREVASAMRQSLGPSSPLALTAEAVAFVTDTVEYAVQVPLDRVNDLADVLVAQARRAGLRNLPIVRFRSRIENDRAGVTVSARW